MLLHMLSDKDKESFLKIATLVCLSDNELHWDGKSLEELTGNVALDTAAFREVDAEKNLMDSLSRECGEGLSAFTRIFNGRSQHDVGTQLLKKLTELPLSRMNATAERIVAASAVLKELIYSAGIDLGLPSIAKVMLYELMLIGLADGEISSVEGALLKQFAEQLRMDDDTYDDLLERAEAMNREGSKTLALILE